MVMGNYLYEVGRRLIMRNLSWEGGQSDHVCEEHNRVTAELRWTPSAPDGLQEAYTFLSQGDCAIWMEEDGQDLVVRGLYMGRKPGFFELRVAPGEWVKFDGTSFSHERE